MKKTIFILALIISSFAFSQIQNNVATEMNWTKNWTSFDAKHESYNSHDAIIPNIITTSTVLSRDNVYLMSGIVYVANNATLTIEPGTLIRCNTKIFSSLVVTKGAKLIAEGTADLPIVFTSSKPVKARRAGDWGGISVIGSGKVNLPAEVGFIEGNYENKYAIYGGKLQDEETTRLSYVRVEFAGKKMSGTQQNVGALALYALGSKSVIKNIMVSYAADDAFQYFGGEAQIENVVSYKSKNDDFNFDLGFKGTLINVLAVRHPLISHSSGSHAVEINGYNQKKGLTSYNDISSVKMINAALITLTDEKTYVHTTAAIVSKNHAKLEFSSSKISGFTNMIHFDDSYKYTDEIEMLFKIDASLCNVYGKEIVAKGKGLDTSNLDKLLNTSTVLTNFKSAKDLFVKPLDARQPKFTLKTVEARYALAQ